MPLDDIFKLNLPSDPDFVSEPPRIPVTNVIRLCEEMLPYYNRQRIENPEPPPVDEPFVLHDPMPGEKDHKDSK